MRSLSSSIFLCALTLMMYLMAHPLDVQHSQPLAANRFEKTVAADQLRARIMGPILGPPDQRRAP
jgi:hypothetical protein